MLIRASCDIALEFVEPTAMILMLRPRSGASQWVCRDEFTFSREVNVIEYVDGYGNLAQRLVAPQGEFSIHSSVDVETTEDMDSDPGAGFVNIEALPESVLSYLVPTRYCESERFMEITRDIIGNAQHGYQQISRITDWIRENVEYRPMSGEVLLSAEEVRQQRHGVCRDLAHLGIAMCRSISIPARLVVGYLHGLTPMTLHAWFEAYVGYRWYAFDPSQSALSGGRVVIAYGRDSADVPIYHQFGLLPLYSTLDVSVSVLKD
jgi:transglutaminase-like putative cysteine protease